MAIFTVGLLLIALGGALASDPPLPTYTNTYYILGQIRLPYAEIVEPFSAYYEAGKSRSRVDYYGIQVTIQKSKAAGLPYGTSYKVIPYSTEQFVNKVGCFQANGTADAPAEITTVLPDLTGFKYIGTEAVEGKSCNVWRNVVVNGKKVNTYTFWTLTDNKMTPFRYEMMGYDSLMGSHYDKYYVDYTLFRDDVKSFPDEVFNPPSNLTCVNFPGPGAMSVHRAELSPITEYIHQEESHVVEEFTIFKKKHGKEFAHLEHETRYHIFRQNLRYINSKNRAGLSFSLAVNHLADRTDKERRRMRGFRYTHGDRGGRTFSLADMAVRSTPDQWDWRLKGAVTPVKDQAICGSCWSFGTTGTIEGANFLKTGRLVVLSQQELIDCSWGEGNNGCDGGEDFRAYKYMLANGGLTSYEQYGQYLAIDGNCKKKEVTPVVQITNYTTVPQGDLQALRVAIFNRGPVSVAIDASHKSLSFYANGVYYEPDCKSGPDDLDHAVLAVGYGTMDGQDYWLIKNSWSTYWGNDGYVLMSQKDNNCGVATDATYVDIK